MLNKFFYNSPKGFTLIEVLLSLSIIAMLSVITIPIFQSFQNRNDLDVAINTIAQNLRRAQVLSQAVNGDSSWGVKVQSGGIVLFKGASYATRDTTVDENFDLSTTINISGVNEVIYSKLDGLPLSTGVTTLTSSINSNETRSITINAKGRLSY